MARKYSKKASKKVAKVMRERKRGTLRSGRSGKKVTSRKQAIAIGLSEARRAGAKVPKKRSSKKRRSRKRQTRAVSARYAARRRVHALRSDALVTPRPITMMSAPSRRALHAVDHFDQGFDEDLRVRLRGAEAREPRDSARRDFRPARPERRRQDDADQHRLRHRQSDRRHDHGRRPRHPHRRARRARS